MSHRRNAYGIVTALLVSTACPAQSGKSPAPATGGPLVTFVELGSVRCVPCRQMQPVMKAIEEKYREQVRVVFHDVLTDEGHDKAEAYRIRLIPTQVFLNAGGKEFHRHEGFYPEAAIDSLLQQRGLKPHRSGS